MTDAGGIILTGFVDQGHSLTTVDDRGAQVVAVCACGWTHAMNEPVTFGASRELQRRFEEHVAASGPFQPL